MTAVPPWARALLRCPACYAELADADAEAGTRLRCTGCGLVYPVRDGVPVMLVGEAVAAGDD